MARKKLAKKPANQQTNHTLAVMLKIEKNFVNTLTKLAAQLTKEISSLKQKEQKLKSALNKIKIQAEKVEKRINKIANESKQSMMSKADKQQLTTIKKLYHNIMANEIKLSKQLEQVRKSQMTLIASQGKLNALKKHITEFEKSYGKNLQPVALSTVKNKVIKLPKQITPDPLTPFLKESFIKPIEKIVEGDNITLDEVAEMTS